MDGFFGWTRQNTNVEQPGIGTNYGTDVLGIPGTNGPKRFQKTRSRDLSIPATLESYQLLGILLSANVTAGAPVWDAAAV